ncbi:MAG: hypothetical protein COT25_00405 [Candidatus Kerfeldbacteria bacterium CG08_land_8_20_14_0_20_42_7]|uniref:Uncharacterized protein n=1 Tax=Candidatus Kerfeldbacteria bacterium CG08_land_8_20_14_0_20_42_7 TaxID=2014245 RepID=A0A2H0YU22_9BACT|nr:MAG: hypothetical protein COT25_00405 [Candidatus Kerfeldbacteria bacterium CG08_land_8_20_14_0_20_42_7]
MEFKYIFLIAVCSAGAYLLVGILFGTWVANKVIKRGCQSSFWLNLIDLVVVFIWPITGLLWWISEKKWFKNLWPVLCS